MTFQRIYTFLRRPALSLSGALKIPGQWTSAFVRPPQLTNAGISVILLEDNSFGFRIEDGNSYWLIED